MYFLLSFDEETNSNNIVGGPFPTVDDADKKLMEEMKENPSVSEKILKSAAKAFDEIEAGDIYVSYEPGSCGYIRDGDVHTYYTIERVDCLSVKKEALEEMFCHYIDRKRYNQENNSDSQNGLYSAGECAEAEKWLEMFGVDLGYSRIQWMVDGKIPVRAFAEKHYILCYFRGRKDSGNIEVFSSLKRSDFKDDDDFLEALVKECTISESFANNVVDIYGD